MKYLTLLKYKYHYLLQTLIKRCLFFGKKWYICPEIPVLQYMGKINKENNFEVHIYCTCALKSYLWAKFKNL